MTEAVEYWDHHAEQVVLGAIFRERSVLDEVIDLVQPTDFHTERHKALYAALLSLYADGKALDVILVSDLLGNDVFAGLGGVEYIAHVMTTVPPGTKPADYANIVQTHAARRRLLTALKEGHVSARSLTNDPYEVQATIEAAFYQNQPSEAVAGLVPMPIIIEHVRERMELLRSHTDDLIGIGTGFADFDILTKGLQAPNLITLAGRSGMGKSTMAFNIATNIGVIQGLPLPIFSLEMTREQVAQKMIPSLSGVKGETLKDPRQMTRDERERVEDAMDRLARAIMPVDDQPGLTTIDFRVRLRRFCMKHQPAVVIVDHIGLMKHPGSRGEYETVTEVIKFLKLCCKEFNICIIALAQVNRKTENRADSMPTLSDLRGSGEIEQTSDMVISPYRVGYYNPDSEEANVTKLLVLKNRHGPEPTIGMYFNAELERFEALASAPAPYTPRNAMPF